MRFATKVERNVVKEFIQKDKTITCPIKGDYYAYIDGRTFDILSALCIVDCNEKLGYYRVQGMRTAKENRHHGYSSEVLKYALSQYSGLVHADCLLASKGIFEKIGFHLVLEKNVGNHIEYQMEKVV